MNFIVEKIIFDYFKGFEHFEADLPFVGSVFGKNGIGKTSVWDGHLWLWTDKDSLLHSNPNIRPDFMMESEPSVTEVINIDGKRLTVRKYQVDGRSKRQKESGDPVRIVNKYEINDVAKTAKDFMKDLTDLGVDFDRFLMLSHEDVFNDMKPTDRRAILFGMTNSISDAEIAKQAECDELAAKLEDRTIDEVTASAKKAKKEADTQLDVIPNKIEGLEMAKTTVDVDALTVERDRLTEVIEQTEEFIRNNRIPDESDFRNEITKLRTEQDALSRNANAEIEQKRAVLKEQIADFRSEQYEALASLDKWKQAVCDAKDGMKACEDDGKRFKAEFDAKQEEFQAEKVKQYPAQNDYCPTCGQKLPEEDWTAAREKWEDERNERLRLINVAGANALKGMRACEASMKEWKLAVAKAHESMKEANGKAVDVENRLEAKLAELDAVKAIQFVDVSGTAEYKAIDEKIVAVEESMRNVSTLRAERTNLMADLNQHKRDRDAILEQLSAVKHNERIDAQIAELKTQLHKYRQSAAIANMLLDQIQTVSMRKNHLFEEQVNSHFSRVKFRLFVTQKNLETKDDCTMMVLTKDGTYREITSSANTAAVELAKLDVLNGLQNFYNQHLPIFLDGMECLDSENLKQIKADTQVISLCVSEDEELVIA